MKVKTECCNADAWLDPMTRLHYEPEATPGANDEDRPDVYDTAIVPRCKRCGLPARLVEVKE